MIVKVKVKNYQKQGKLLKCKIFHKHEVNQAEKLQRKSIDELKEIARSRRIKNRDKLTKEGLVISLLKQKATMQNVII